MELLSTMFEKARSGSITWQGLEVAGLYEFSRVPEVFDIHFVSGRTEPAQALFVSVGGGRGTVLRGSETEHHTIAFFSRSFPHQERVQVIRKGLKPLSLKVWNAWEHRSKDGRTAFTNYWQGNAGMLVEEHSGLVRLRCSDGAGDGQGGFGAVDFSNLVVEIHYDPDLDAGQH